MRIIPKSKYKRKIIIASLIVVVALGGYTAFAATQNIWPFPAEERAENVDYSEPTDEQRQSGSEASNRAKEEPADETSEYKEPDENSETYETDVTITSAGQNGDQLQIRTLINTTSAGHCTLTLSGGGQTITREADTQALASSSTCMGFDIPRSEVSAGEWIVRIDYRNSSATGSAEQTITIE